jgi:hypothetical protein
MPIFMAFLSAYPLSNRLGNGTTDDPHGIRKKAVCDAIHFGRLSRVDRPSRPLSEMAGRGVREAKTLFLQWFIALDPPRQPPIFGGGEGQGANSIWRHPDPPLGLLDPRGEFV